MKHAALTLAASFILSTAVHGQATSSYSIGTTNWADVSFADSLTGWICGDTMLLRTTDGGQTWSGIDGLSGSFSSVAAVGGNKAFASWTANAYSRVGKTTDGGVWWDTTVSSCVNCISNIYFSRIKARDSLRAWVAERAEGLADFVYVLRSTDAGHTWTSCLPSHGSPFAFADLSLAPDSLVAALFARRMYYRSSDDGAHWIVDTLAKPCNAVTATADRQFWAAGDSGVVYHSAGYSTPFSQQSTGFTQNINALFPVGSQTVWAVGDSGLVARTTDGGASWARIPSNTASALRSVHFSDARHGWIVGDNGTVLRVRDEVISSVSEPTAQPLDITLYPNYPNPFNPATNISFSIPNRSFVSLEVYDLVGRKISVLVNEELPAGRYMRTWDAVNMPSGTYLCRLTAGSFGQTGKLVLVR